MCIRDSSREDLIYLGGSTDLQMTQRFKINYNCLLDLSRYPFGKHSCDFIMNIKVTNNSIHFVEDSPSLIYLGPTVLNEYQVEEWRTATNLTPSMSVYMFSIKIDHLYVIPLITTFYETFLLWMLAYITLFFDIADFGDRIMACITSLSVSYTHLTLPTNREV